MTPPRKLLALQLLVGLLVASACTGNGNQAPPSTTIAVTTTTERIVDGGPATAAFFDALASRDPAMSAAMLSATAPGSVARAYAEHQVAVREVLGPTEPSRSEQAPDRTVICSRPADLEQTQVCTDFRDLQLDTDGHLTNFTIGGVAIDDRVIGAGPSVTVDRIEVRAVSGYRSPTSEATFAVIEVDNGSNNSFELFPFAATYRASNTSPAVEADASWGTTTIGAGSSGRVLVRFADTPLRGVLQVSGWSDAGTGATFAVRLAPAP